VYQAIGTAKQSTHGALREQRRQSRSHLLLSAQVFRAEQEADACDVRIRDINILGAFLYCDFDVTVGEMLWVELTPVQSKSPMAVNCEARVIRVEKAAMQGMTGIAVEFNNFVVQSPNESSNDYVNKPVMNWTVERIDQSFARRPEFQAYASRIQGAA